MPGGACGVQRMTFESQAQCSPPLCGSQGLNSRCQAWQQAPVLAEAS